MKKSVFERSVNTAFLGLEASFGFKKTAATYADRGVCVRYSNETTEVCLNYEIGDTPWLEIAELKNPANRTTLGWLLVERGQQPPPTVEQAFRPAPLAEPALEACLLTLGKQVAEHGADLLRGDFSLLPKLQVRAKKYDADCKRYMAAHRS